MAVRVCVLTTLATFAAPEIARAAPIVVTDSVSGSPGDWVHEFTVTNHISSTLGGLGILLFGVQLPMTDIVGSPTGWHFIPSYVPCCHDVFGGSLTLYNNPWAYDNDNPSTVIAVGETVTGFRVRDTSLVAWINVLWFAFAYNFDHDGEDLADSTDGHFYIDRNPGYEGIALRDVQVPEPSSLLLFGTGALGLIAARRRKRSA